MKNESQASFLYNRILYSGTELIVPIPCLNIYVENVYHLENKNNFQKEGKLKIKDKFENGDNRTHEDNHRMAIGHPLPQNPQLLFEYLTGNNILW